MSGGDGAPPGKGGKGPKQLSSRLMTMKFMQRAAATPTGAAAAAAAGSDSSAGPNPKRLKNNRSQPSTPPNGPRDGPSAGTRTPAYAAAASSSGKKDSGIDWRRAAQEAARAEEERRQAALERAGTQGEETRWVLCTVGEGEESARRKRKPETGLRIVRYGEAEDGEENEVGDMEESQPWRAEAVQTGRMRFGGFKRKGEAKLPARDTSDDNGSDAESDSDASRASRDSNNESPADNGKRKGSKTAEPAFRTPTRDRGSGGISSGGGSGGRPSDGGGGKCFRCGQSGHMKRDCPMNQNAIMGSARAGRR